MRTRTIAANLTGKITEAATLKAITQYLQARRVMAFRMNSGAMHAETNGKARFMRFGVPGMADLLAFPTVMVRDITRGGAGNEYREPRTLWIEVKSPIGKQSELQKSFQLQVEAEGHRYIVARSIEDVERHL